MLPKFHNTNSIRFQRKARVITIFIVSMEEKREVTINVTKDQWDTVEGIYNFHGWSLEVLNNKWEQNTVESTPNSDERTNDCDDTPIPRVMTSFDLLTNTQSGQVNTRVSSIGGASRDNDLKNEAPTNAEEDHESTIISKCSSPTECSHCFWILV